MINNILINMESSPLLFSNYIKIMVAIVAAVSTVMAYLSFRTNSKTLTQNQRNRLIDCAKSLVNGNASEHDEIKIDIAFYDYSKKIIELKCLRKVLKSDLPHRNLDHLAKAGHLFKLKNNKLLIQKNTRSNERIKFFSSILFFIFGLIVWVSLYNVIPAILINYMDDYPKSILLIFYLSVIAFSTVWGAFVLSVTYPVMEKFRSIRQLESL